MLHIPNGLIDISGIRLINTFPICILTSIFRITLRLGRNKWLLFLWKILIILNDIEILLFTFMIPICTLYNKKLKIDWIQIFLYLRTNNTRPVHRIYVIMLCKRWTSMISTNLFPQCMCKKITKKYQFLWNIISLKLMNTNFWIPQIFNNIENLKFLTLCCIILLVEGRGWICC